MLSERKWNLETVPHLLVGLYICVFFSSAAFSLADLVRPEANLQQKQFRLLVLSAVFVHGMLLAMMLVFLRLNKVGLIEGMGLRQGSPLRAWLIGSGATVVVLPVCLLLSRLCALLIESAGSEAHSQVAVQFLQARPPWYETAFLGFSTIVLAPVVEEMLFRGILYPSVKQAGFPRAALFATAFLFAAYHSNLMAFVPLYFLAIVLTLVYEATDNLLSAIALHAWFNAINFGMLVFNWDVEAWLKKLF